MRGKTLSVRSLPQLEQDFISRTYTSSEIYVTHEDVVRFFINLLEPIWEKLCEENTSCLYETLTLGLQQALIRLAIERYEDESSAAVFLGIPESAIKTILGAICENSSSSEKMDSL